MVTTTTSAPSPQSRIRDNQRRSRARRKEYLTELETKYRTCEQIGAEASAEIQAAARKVAEENRRLRSLLLNHGITDPELSRVEIRDVPLSDDARALNAMLSTRKACGDGDLRQCSAPPTSLRVPLPMSPIEDPNLRSLAPYPDPAIPPPQQAQQLWPAPPAAQSCNSRCGPSSSNTPPLHTPISPLPPYQLQSSEEQQYYLPPTSADQQQLPPTQPQYQQEPANGTSCYAVASMIRSMNPHIGAELEAELGCADGGECDVSNLRAFEVLDRMSGGA